MKCYFLILITVLLQSSTVFSQPSANNFDKVWVQGGGLSYTTTFGSGGVVNQFLDTVNSPYFIESANSNICDSNGNLLYCSDGFQIYDKNVNVIDGGNVVPPAIFNFHGSGFSNISQSSIFLPMANGKYYFITPTASDDEVHTYWEPDSVRIIFDLLLYNVIDAHANNGAGKVVRSMVPLLQNVLLSKTQMMACKHADGKSWWLLKQAHDTNLVYKFLFTQDSVFGPYIQGFAEPHFTFLDQSGQSVFSKDGTKYATTCRGAHKIFIADFDRCNGGLTNPQVYDVPVQLYAPDTTYNDFTQGLAFSPNGRFLYVNGYSNIQQIDLQAVNPTTSWVKVAGVDTTLNVFQMYSSMYLGADNKLYIGNYNNLSGQMSVISDPDNKGAACDFCPRCLRFPLIQITPGNWGAGVASPPCMPNYRLGPRGSGTCPPADVPGIVQHQSEFKLYPNPTNSFVTVEYTDDGILQITDVMGRIIQTTMLSANSKKQTVDIPNLLAGIYYYRYLVADQMQSSGKLIIQ